MWNGRLEATDPEAARAVSMLRQPSDVEWGSTVFDLGGLRFEARPRPSHSDRWFDCTITVDAPPFAGAVETIFTDEDLTGFADELERLDPVGEATLGGGRAAELRLIVEEQIGGEPGALAVECSLTPSGDDPYPLIRFLLFDVRPFSVNAADRLRELAAIEPWPRPSGA